MKHLTTATSLILSAMLAVPALAQDWRQDVKVVTSESDPTVALKGKRSEEKNDELSERSWSLVTSVDKKSRQASTSLQFGMLYKSTAWQNWRVASTADGRALEVLATKKALLECKGTCTFFEQIEVAVPADVLAQAAAGPVQLRFGSEFGGQQVITVDPVSVGVQQAATTATIAALR